MREKDIERALVKAVKARGGLCMKFVSPGLDGVPDRIVLLPPGKIGFVEVKAPGKKPRAVQLVRHREIHNCGFGVYILDDAADIEVILDDIQGA